MSGYDTAASGRYVGVIGVGMAVVQAVAFTAVGYFALDSPVFGAVAGLFSGVGTYLFFPWFFSLQNDHGESIEEIGFAEAASRAEGSSQLAVFGLGLDIGSVTMLTAGFSLAGTDLLVGTGIAVATTLAVALAGSVALDWRG